MYNLSFEQVVDQAVTAEYLDYHAGDTNAEILDGFEKVADHCPFYQCAEHLVGKNNEYQNRNGNTLEVVGCKGGTNGKKYGLGKDSRKSRHWRHAEQEVIYYRR